MRRPRRAVVVGILMLVVGVPAARSFRRGTVSALEGRDGHGQDHPRAATDLARLHHPQGAV